MSMFTTRVLLNVLKQLPAVDLFLLNKAFKRTKNFETDEIALDKIDEDRGVSVYVSTAVNGPLSEAPAKQVKTYKAPSIVEKERVPADAMKERAVGESFDAPKSPADRLKEWVARRLLVFRNRITRRWVLQVVEILTTGKVTITGPHHPDMLVDYDRHPDLTVTLSGAAAWGQAGVKALDTLKAMAADIAEHALGAVARDVIMSQSAWEKFILCEDIQELLKLQRLPNVGLNMDPQSNGRGVDDKGTFGDFHVYVYNDGYKDKDGVSRKFLPDNTVILLDEAAFDGVMCFASVELPTPDKTSLVSINRPIVPDQYTSDDPVGLFLRSQSKPLPVPMDVNASACATVG